MASSLKTAWATEWEPISISREKEWKICASDKETQFKHELHAAFEVAEKMAVECETLAILPLVRE